MAASKRTRRAKAATPESEDQVFWTAALRRRVIAHRGVEGGVRAPQPSRANAQAALEAELAKRQTIATAAIAARIPGHEVLARVTSDAAHGRCPTSDDDAAALHAWLTTSTLDDVESAPEVCVSWLARVGGLARAVAASVLAVDLAWVVNGHRYDRWHRLTLQSVPELALTNLQARSLPSPFAQYGTLDGLDLVRAYLADTDDRQYEDALRRARELRATATTVRRVALSYLFPSERDWVEGDLASLGSSRGYRWLLTSATRPEGLAGLSLDVSELFPTWVKQCVPGDIAATLLANLGVGCAPLLAAVEQGRSGSYGVDLKRWFDTLAAVGDDATIHALVAARAQTTAQRALVQAAKTQPRRVLRCIASAVRPSGKDTATLRAQLRLLVSANPGLAAEVTPTLGEVGARMVMDILASQREAPVETPTQDEPAFLRDPPWRKKAAPVARRDDVVMPRVPPVLQLAPQEQVRWRASSFGGASRFANLSPEAWGQLAQSDSQVSVEQLAVCPAEHFDALLRRCAEKSDLDAVYYESVVATHGLAALPLLVTRADTDLTHVWTALAPVGAMELVPLMARVMATRRALAQDAGAWLLRFPEHAAAGLLPAALGKPGKEREYAERALQHLAEHGQEAALLRVAERVGVRLEVQALLTSDPLSRFPAKRPKPSGFLDPAVLERPLLRHGGAPLSSAATLAVLELLAFCAPECEYVGLELLAEACDRASLERFSWSVAQTWLAQGAPSKDGFCLTQLALIGGDPAARKLGTLIPDWTRPTHKLRALTAIDTLATLGSDVALMQLQAVATKVKQPGVKARAQAAIDQAAERRGLTRDEIEDRLTPDLGLDDRGSMQLDYGARAFTVGFDDTLRPVVRDDAGRRVENLPKPRQDDDPVMAQLAQERWAALKRDAKKAIVLRLSAMEQALRTRRRVTAETFSAAFVRHPLTVHIARRLVWGAYSADGAQLLSSFRIAEDGSFADQTDQTVALPSDASVGLVHPLELDNDELAAWSATLADYDIVQPFAQLARRVHVLDAADADLTTIGAVEGVVVRPGAIFAFEAKGWLIQEQNGDSGMTVALVKRLPGGLWAELPVEPGYQGWDRRGMPDQMLGSLQLHRSGHTSGDSPPFSVLGRFTYSELLHDLDGLGR